MSILVGIVVGALVGYFVYPRIKLTFDPPEQEIMRGKTEARLSAEGTPIGAWLGAATGLVVGTVRRLPKGRIVQTVAQRHHDGRRE